MNRDNAVALGFYVAASAVTISMLSVLACSYGIIDLPFYKSVITKPVGEVKLLTDSGTRIRAADKIITSDQSPR
jgi:hypothetical protein